MWTTNNNARSFFQVTAGYVFVLTGLAKVVSALGHSRVLEYVDPIFDMQFFHLMLIAGLLEGALGLYCLLAQPRITSIIFVAWLSSFLLAYRLALWFVDWHRPCKCLGDFTDAIHISSGYANLIMKVILGYLILGSYFLLCVYWFKEIKASGSRQK